MKIITATWQQMSVTFVLIKPSSAPAWMSGQTRLPSPCPATLGAVTCLCGEFLNLWDPEVLSLPFLVAYSGLGLTVRSPFLTCGPLKLENVIF